MCIYNTHILGCLPFVSLPYKRQIKKKQLMLIGERKDVKKETLAKRRQGERENQIGVEDRNWKKIRVKKSDFVFVFFFF